MVFIQTFFIEINYEQLEMLEKQMEPLYKGLFVQ